MGQTVRYIPVPMVGTVYMGIGIVMEICTGGIPVLNPTDGKCSSPEDQLVFIFQAPNMLVESKLFSRMASK
jgi:hypothetical protein